MGNNLTKFEESVHTALDGYEVPYEAASWDRMNQKLDAVNSNGKSNALAAAALVGAVVLGSAGWYYLSTSAGAEGKMVGLTVKVKDHQSYESLNQKTNAHNETISWNDATQTNELDNSAAEVNDAQITTNSSAQVQIAQNVNPQDSMTESETSEVETTSNQAQLTEPQTTFPKNVVTNNSSGKEEVNFGISARVACVGTTIEFNIENQDANGNYLWNFGDGNFSNQPDPSHTYYKPGAYDVTLSVASTNDGVIRTKTIDNMIVVNPSPEGDFEWEFINNSEEKPTVQIVNKSTRAESCTWIVDEGATNSEINPSVEFSTKGEHVVHLQVSNEFGCIDHKYKYINVDKDYKLMAPEKISPNADGSFDTFMPAALHHMNKPFKLTIYDNNEVIFESNKAENAWDGALSNGLLAPVGEEYPWIVILYNEFGEEEFYSGTITIAP
jgi:PKD repeat protein